MLFLTPISQIWRKIKENFNQSCLIWVEIPSIIQKLKELTNAKSPFQEQKGFFSAEFLPTTFCYAFFKKMHNFPLPLETFILINLHQFANLITSEISKLSAPHKSLLFSIQLWRNPHNCFKPLLRSTSSVLRCTSPTQRLTSFSHKVKDQHGLLRPRILWTLPLSHNSILICKNVHVH